ALGMTNLNGGTLFNAEFGIRHRAAPYRKGQVLHSVFAAALFLTGDVHWNAAIPNGISHKHIVAK
ncbi:hypothetical protein P6U18_21215, partial [Pseudomonas sp. L01]|nr:hypothetical protein [Pseudomonas sp. L01]